MERTVIIEEHIVEEFLINIPDGVNPHEFIAEQYYKEKIILESGECQFKKMKIINNKDENDYEWKEF